MRVCNTLNSATVVPMTAGAVAARGHQILAVPPVTSIDRARSCLTAAETSSQGLGASAPERSGWVRYESARTARV
jgi:hypothetical protein